MPSIEVPKVIITGHHLESTKRLIWKEWGVKMEDELQIPQDLKSIFKAEGTS